jgi:hypothetical protein
MAIFATSRAALQNFGWQNFGWQNFVRQNATLQTPPQNPITPSTDCPTLVIIDSAVDDCASLAAGVQPGTEVLILHPQEDGIAQITSALAHYRQIQALHIISHGGPGTLYLGNTRLNNQTLPRYTAQIQQWRNALAPNTDLLLYGCCVAADPSLIEQLHQLTGMHVAASAAPIGNGNWNLETHTGNPGSLLAFTAAIEENYVGEFGLVVKGSYDTPGEAFGVSVVGNLAYVADWGDGLQILDISNPASPTFVGSYNTPGWSYDASVVDNLAYIADHDGGLQILDISNPSNPTFVASYDIPGNAYDVSVAGNLAYVVSNYWVGLQILDISNPTSPTFVGSYQTPSYALGVSVVGNLAYIADRDAGLQILDISNPASPTFVGSYDTPAQGLSVVGNFAYVANGDAGLQILDISSPTNPTLVGSYDTPDYAFGVSVVGNLAYIADSWAGLQIIDISDPTNPTLKASYDTPGYASGVNVVDNLAYVTDGDAGLQIIGYNNRPTSTDQNVTLNKNTAYSFSAADFNFSDSDTGDTLKDVQITQLPTQGQLFLDGNANNLEDPGEAISHEQTVPIANLDTLTFRPTANAVGSPYSSFQFKVSDGYEYSDSAYTMTFNVLGQDDSPLNPILKGIYDTPGWAWEVSIVGNLAYVTDGDAGLQILDISNPSNPTFVGSYNTLEYAQGVSVVGNFAYVTNGYLGLQILDISNPSNPTFVGSYDTAEWAHRMSVVGNLAYVVDGWAGLRILDLSNPTSPTFVGSYQTPSFAFDASVVDNFAYIADRDAGLQILDISNPSNPTLVGSYDTPDDAQGLSVVGNFAYIADKDAGLQIIDISSPANPTLVGSYDTPDDAYDVSVVGNLAYIADHDSGLQIIDISDPTHPTLKASYDTPDTAISVTVVDNLAYVADWRSGLLIIDVGNTASTGFTLGKSSASVSETGTSESFTVQLNTQPTSTVVLTVTSSDTDEATASPTLLTFTPNDWNQPQTVTVTGVDDSAVDGSQTSTLTIAVDDASSDNTFDAIADQIVTVTTEDDDIAGFTLSQSSASVSETGTTDTFTVQLNAQPLTDVVLTVATSNTGEATTDKTSVFFTPDTWNQPQTVTIAGVDDNPNPSPGVTVIGVNHPLIDGDATSTITVSVDATNSEDTFDSLSDQIVTITTTDNDVPGLTIIFSDFPSEIPINLTYGTDIDDVLNGSNKADYLSGLDGRDVITGLAQADYLAGDDGGDALFGNQGNDTLDGGRGKDFMFAGNGDDFARGGLDDDLLKGENGADRLDGDTGNDFLFGNTGNDSLSGGEGNDSIFAGNENDVVKGDADDDYLVGENGNDILGGDDGNDAMFGNSGSDVLDGDSGNDTLLGGRDSDTLFGGMGEDILRGELGEDELIGGSGGDQFEFRRGDGNDRIADFQDGVDTIGLIGGLTFAQLQIIGVGSDTQIKATGLTITLQGVNVSAIDSSDFYAVIL